MRTVTGESLTGSQRGDFFISEEWSNGLAAVANELKRRGLAEMKTCNIDLELCNK